MLYKTTSEQEVSGIGIFIGIEKHETTCKK